MEYKYKEFLNKMLVQFIIDKDLHISGMAEGKDIAGSKAVVYLPENGPSKLTPNDLYEELYADFGQFLDDFQEEMIHYVTSMKFSHEDGGRYLDLGVKFYEVRGEQSKLLEQKMEDSLMENYPEEPLS